MLVARSDLSESKLIWRLGIGGLIPFYGTLVLVTLTGAETFWLTSQTIYAALIISFIGAVYWGLSLYNNQLEHKIRVYFLLYGVTPALFAWGILLLPLNFRFGPLSALLCACLAADALFRSYHSKAWIRVRICLTLGGSASLLLSQYLYT
ncbi:MAG: DUF3429 domain-containing protein [Burkholderiales bacterium]